MTVLMFSEANTLYSLNRYIFIISFDLFCLTIWCLLVDFCSSQAVLGPEVPDGEVNVIEVEAMGYKSDIKFPVVVLKGGAGHSQCVLDLLFPDPPVTFKLVKGNGPIHLLGNHSVGSKYL